MLRLALIALLVAGCQRAEDRAHDPAKRDSFLDFATATPAPGELAPVFELTSIDGVRMNPIADSGPVVLVFASFTCPPSRMKLPGLEALARRWRDRAEVYVIYSREAHPHAQASARLNAFADQVQARDRNGDGTVTLVEYGDLGPRYMFDAFDLDHDGEVRSYELLAARRLDQFKDVDAPMSLEERLVLAHRLRDEVPGTIPILVDGLDDAVADAYGGLPNMAYVIEGGRVTFKLPWAAVADIERELSIRTGAAAPAVAQAPDLAIVQPQLEAAKAAGKPLLLELTATGCHACEAMARTLEDPELQPDLARYQIARIGIEHDPEWRLFESLQLVATPALVVMTDGAVHGSLQGAHDRDAVLAFLRR